MIPTQHIIRLLGEFTTSPTVGRVVKTYGEMPATRPYKPRAAPPLENETKEDARKRQKRESYAANREQVLIKQREQKAIKRASKRSC